jgi:hypothetical protein
MLITNFYREIWADSEIQIQDLDSDEINPGWKGLMGLRLLEEL